MDSEDPKGEYRAIKIPKRDEAAEPRERKNPDRFKLETGETFYEIDYSASPIKGVGKFVPRKVPVRKAEPDRFKEMRDIARNFSITYIDFLSPYSHAVKYRNAKVFYSQALLMADFTDDWKDPVPFFSYFPTYQMMNTSQLHTYFTWRTGVRAGRVEATSLSYTFVYLYELLHNIGTDSPAEALEQILRFWKAYRVYDKTLDEYLRRWLKDYSIYYELPKESEEKLFEEFPAFRRRERNYEFYRTLSNYDPGKSQFYDEKRHALIEESVISAISAVGRELEKHGRNLDSLLFYSPKNSQSWTPFKGAVFYPYREGGNRTVVVSPNEVYLCREGRWTCTVSMTSGQGKRLLGYIMKKSEAVLRKRTGYPHDLRPSVNSLPEEIRVLFDELSVDLDRIIEDAVLKCYQEANRTVVKVSDESLSRIRADSLATEKALTVPETEERAREDGGTPSEAGEVKPQAQILPGEIYKSENDDSDETDPWDDFENALTRVERDAIAAILRGESLYDFSSRTGEMPEILGERINEKALDFIGDSILNEDLSLFPEYEDAMKGLES